MRCSINSKFVFGLFSLLFLLPIFTFSQSDNRSIRISPRDPRYLEYSDGQPYIQVGLNMIGVGNMTTEKGLALMQEWMKNLADNRGNYIRLWASDKFWEVEHQKSGEFDEVKAAERLDKIIVTAQQYNFRVKVTLEHFRHFNEQPSWSGKPINHVSNGGPATTVDDYFTNPISHQAFLKRLDWFAGRYAANPTIFTWELWNEINAVNGGGLTMKEVKEQYDWTAIMLPAVKQRYPNRLATQSLGSFDDSRVRETYKAFTILPQNDLAQVHRYLDLGANLEICKTPVATLAADAVKELRAFTTNKPAFLAESGAVEPKHAGPFKLYAADKAGIILHDVLFAPFFAGAAGAGQIWHWNDYVAKNNLWFHFARFSEAVKNIDPPAEGFEPLEETQQNIQIYGLKGKSTSLIWCRDMNNTWITELQEGKTPSIISNFKLNVKAYLGYKKKAKIQIYDPWENKWKVAKVKKGTVKLPAFSRSLVLRIEN